MHSSHAPRCVAALSYLLKSSSFSGRMKEMKLIEHSDIAAEYEEMNC